MLKVILALCLIGSIVNGQTVSFTTGTSLSANQAYSVTSGTTTTQVGAAVQAAQGYTVGLVAPGWILSNQLTLTAAATPTATVVYTTVKRQAGGFVGIGIAQIGGTGSQVDTAATPAPRSCDAFGTRAAGAVLANRLSGSSAGTDGVNAYCPTDFITLYTARPTSTSIVTASQLTLTVDTPVKWTLTPPPSATTANQACVQTAIQPYTAAGVAGTALTTINAITTAATPAGTCDSGVPSRFSLTTASSATGGQYAFYVELGPGGTAAEVCFQTQAQFTASPGVCSSSIITGVIASIGLLVALLFN